MSFLFLLHGGTGGVKEKIDGQWCWRELEEKFCLPGVASRGERELLAREGVRSGRVPGINVIL
jgi:hypothetical protein